MRRRGLLAGAIVSVVALHLVWLLPPWARWAQHGLDERDWAAFHHAGRRLVDGRLGEVYAPEPGGYPFYYPPPAIPLSAPLAPLPPWAAYIACIAFAVACFAAAAVLLGRLVVAPREEHGLFVVACLSAAPWISVVHLGQLSALWLVAVVGGIALVRRDRAVAGGLLLSILSLKPNLGLPFLLLAAASRRWKLALGQLAGVGLLVAIALPLGTGPWGEWLDAIGRVTGQLDAAAVDPWKQQTLHAFVRSLTPAVGTGAAATVAWLLLGVPTAAAILRAWWPGPTAVPPARLASIAVLAVLALNRYAYFYDTLLLVVPAASVWLLRAGWYHRTTHRIAAGCAVGTWLFQHLSLFHLQTGVALTGLLLWVWLAAELADVELGRCLSRRAARRRDRPCSAGPGVRRSSRSS